MQSAQTDGAGAAGYARVLRSSAITGGSTAINMLIGLGSVKAMAILIGPSGVGELRLYQTSLNLISAAAGLGLVTSGVRSIAQSEARHDRQASMRLSVTIGRLAIVTGLTGWLLTAVISGPLSNWVFGDDSHRWAYVCLGATVLFELVRGGMIAPVWGFGRIGQLAKITVASALVGAISSIAAFIWLGSDGVVVCLMLTSASSLLTTYALSRCPDIEGQTQITWREVMQGGIALMKIGSATMIGGVLTALVATGAGAVVVHYLGLRESGMYAAAWGLSGLLANFILNAMAADFFPRLSAVHDNKEALRRLVNEQTEIGVLLAVPGLVATIAFSSWILLACYTPEFLEAKALLSWMAVGVFGRVTSWPLGYVLLARGDGKLFILAETLSAGVHLALVAVFTRYFGLTGAGIGFLASYAIYNGAMLAVNHRRNGVAWSAGCGWIVAGGFGLVLVAHALSTTFGDTMGLAAGAAVSIVSGAACARLLAKRLGPSHRLVRVLGSVPVVGRLTTTK